MKYTTIIDNTGRTILGETVEDTEELIRIKNPAMIHVGQTQNGQLQVQILPLFFPEFLAQSERENGSVWTYSTKSVAVGNVVIEEKLIEQYRRIFNPSPIFQPGIQAPTNAPIVKLFD